MKKAKRQRSSESITSNKSLSSLSDAAVKAGRKAKQAAFKTVKSLTALIKPRRRRIVPDSKSKLYHFSNIFDLSWIGDDEPEKADEHMGAEDATVTRTSSIMD